jgi:nucleoid-associated protein YgaU
VVGIGGLVVGRDAESAAAPRPSRRHVVQAGETLWQIARERAGQDDPRPVIREIQEINGLGTSPLLMPGTTLRLP